MLTRLPLTAGLALLAALAALTSCADSASGKATSAGAPSGNGAADAGSQKQANSGTSSTPGNGGGAQAADAGSSGQSNGDKSNFNPAPPANADASAGAAADASAPKDSGKADAGSTDAGADAGPQCNTTEPTQLYLSADDSNSMASATVARGLILQGQYAYKPVRPWEFLNYYDFPYPAALPNEITISAQLRADNAEKGQYRLQVAVRAPDFSEATRRRFQIVLTVDTSSSMGWGPQGDRGIDRARAACTGLVQALDAGDVFTLVRWGKTVDVVVDGKAMKGKDNGELAQICNQLEPNGDSPLSQGLATAYAQAKKYFSASAINRVVLVSDGGANVGEQDVKVIAAAAKNAEGKDDGTGIYLMGAGVGDPWNYNDKLMNAVTDAGKGAYVFLDSQQEATDLFAKALLRHLEVAARNVQVQVTLPPTFAIQQFYGEQISTKKEDVEPQHLAANDAMIFHQTLQSCAPNKLTGQEKVAVVATWEHPVTHKPMTTNWSATFGDLLAGNHALLDKGAAVVAYCDALTAAQGLDGKAAADAVAVAQKAVTQAQQTIGKDADLGQIGDLLATYAVTLGKGQQSGAQKGGSGADPIGGTCSCTATGGDLKNAGCALDLCDSNVLLGSELKSPTDSKTDGTFAVVNQFGGAGNHLKPQIGGNYVLLATGPATGTSHSTDVGGTTIADPFAGGQQNVHNAIELRLHLKAPAGANGLRFRHVFFSEEYDDYVGSSFNDKFYAVLQAGSTNGGAPTVINYTDCRNPQQYYDFVCSPGMQFCDPKARYCYIAINTALSECCWLNGCPNGKAKTNISGTGFECAANQSSDGPGKGSSTGWLMTEWPIEPGEDFYLTFHVHDAGDGIFDSEVILDGLQFVGKVNPGTYVIPPM